LNGFNQNRADGQPAKHLTNRLSQTTNLAGVNRKGHEVGELGQLRTKGQAEMFTMRGIERAVSKPVITLLKSDNTGSASCKQSGFERCLNRLES
jgi:hypothetical protein